MKTLTRFFIIPAFIIITTFLFVSCSSDNDEQEPTYRELELAFLKEFREDVRGEWKIEKMVITKGYIFSDPQKDSVIYDLGTIFVNNIYNHPIHADKYNQLEASIYINREIIPIKSELLASSGYNDEGNFIFNGVFGLIMSDYHIPFPVSSDSFSEEYRFLSKYFLGDNYSMILSEDGKTWTWKGLNRFTREIVLKRNNFY